MTGELTFKDSQEKPRRQSLKTGNHSKQRSP